MGDLFLFLHKLAHQFRDLICATCLTSLRARKHALGSQKRIKLDSLTALNLQAPRRVEPVQISVYAMLMKGGENQSSDDLPQKAAKAATAISHKLLILWLVQQGSNLRLPPCEGGRKAAG